MTRFGVRRRVGSQLLSFFRPTVTMWRRGGVAWWRIGKRVGVRSWEDDVLGRAAELSYFFLFSSFPLLLFLATLLGLLAQVSGEWERTLFRWVAQIAPSREVTELLRAALRDITEGASGWKLAGGILVALWVASNGILALGRTLNTACSLKETRGFWRRRLVSLGLTLVFAALTVVSLAVVLFGGQIGELLADRVGLDVYFAALWSTVQWPVVMFFVLLAFDVIYNYAPNVPRRDRVWLTPGALTALALWVGASMGLRLYLVYFGYTRKAYGSIGVAIILLLWFYLAGLALLLGGEVNSECGAAARHDPADAEERPEREPAAV